MRSTPYLDEGEPLAQGFNHAPDPRDSILHAIHTRFGENLNNLLSKVGVPAPDNWTPTEPAAQVIDAEGNALYAFEAFENLLTHKIHSPYFIYATELISLMMGS